MTILPPADKAPLRDKLAQLLFVRIGSNMPPVRTVEEDGERVEALLREIPLGGLILFNGQRDKTSATLQTLQSVAKYPLLVGADIERGVGQQVRGYTLLPHSMAFEALGEDAERCVYEFARLTGLAARAHGIHITFSPVADVNTDPRNPIIATRAFGESQDTVTRLVTSYIAGAKDGGILATAKHFPGHGSTFEDSHHALPTVERTREELEMCELVPFRAAIASGVPLVMTAHVRFSQLDNSGRPATLSKPILTDLLRGELNYKGAVVSDSLLMEGVRSQHSNEGELVLQALLAGVDLQLDVEDPHLVLNALERAVTDGRLPLERVDEAYSRLAVLKQRVTEHQKPNSSEALARVTEQSEQLANHVARRSIQTVASARRLVPLDVDRDLTVLMLRPNQSHLDPPEQPLGKFLGQHFDQCDYVELTPSSIAADYRHAVDRALAASQLVIAMIVKPAAWHKFGLLPQQDELVRELTAKCDCVLCCLGTPKALDRYDDATERVCTYSDVFVSQAALADLLAGHNSNGERYARSQ